VVGPAIGGFILGFSGASSAFFVNAVSFLGLIIYYWRWPIATKDKVHAEKPTSYFQKITSQDWNILFSLHNLKLWVEILAVSFSASAMWALYPVRGRIELQLSSYQYGSLLACLGFGALLSALFSKHVMNPERNWQSLSFAYLVFAAAETVLAFADVYYMAAFAMVLGGIGWIILATLMNMSTRQLSAQSHLKATMLGVFLSVFYLGMSLGSVTWGTIARFKSTSYALLISAVCLALCSVYKFARKK
jgi:predicted MFS family arabinose efflux permease